MRSLACDVTGIVSHACFLPTWVLHVMLMLLWTVLLVLLAVVQVALLRLLNKQAGTEEGLGVAELQVSGGNINFQRLGKILRDTEVMPSWWPEGDIINLFRNGDGAVPGNYSVITLLQKVLTT